MGGYGYVLADTLSYGPDEVIFEAGSGPESTPYLANCAELHTADIAAGFDAVQALREWPADGPRIKFAYLDSHDWPYRNMNQDELARQQAAYAARGAELTEDASAEHHLELAIALEPLAAPGAVAVFDDTWADPGAVLADYRWDGKGRDGVPYLLALGWRLCAFHLEPWTGTVGVQRTGRNAFYVAVRR